MTDQTPSTQYSVPSTITTETVRECASEFDVSLSGQGPAFDAWLATHDREVAAKALREAAQLGHQAFVDWTAGERHRKRGYGCYFVSVADLYARALRIEDGH